ncbi:MAG TPA: hypothetical protein VEZ70_06525 [Allosphingosinicella sp.]|nr:hypothetical protein [Allosphingosinicella sp.]
MPLNLAGLRRGPILDATEAELDISSRYAVADGSLVATFYVFRPGLQATALWFDRAAATMALNPRFGIPAEVALPVPMPFAPVEGGPETGLRMVAAADGREFTSTGLAVARVGDFLVKVRITARRLPPEALDAKLTEVLRAIGWPSIAKPATAIRPMEECKAPLKLRKAKAVRDDLAQVLVSAMLPLAVKGETGVEPAYCREPGARAPWQVYRLDGSTKSYVVGFGDSGTALSLAPTLGLPGLGSSGDAAVSMTLLQHETASVMASFNRLPPPEQAVSTAFGGKGRIRVSISSQ